MVQSQFLTKNGLAATEVARDLFTRKVGDRIPRISDYAQRLGTGNGTIQAALKRLESSGAVKFDTRGHLGSYILEIDYQRLWELSGRTFVVGTMPLPYSRRYEGFATGLYEAFSEAGIPFSLSYMRGAAERLKVLANGNCDFVILSRLAAEHALEKGELIRIVANFGPESYVGAHGVLLADPGGPGEILDGMRVGIDPESIDQSFLTEAECRGKNVQLVKVPYMQLVPKLQSRVIDATIWNTDEIRDRGVLLRVEPLRQSEARELERKNTEAVLVVPSDRIGATPVLTELIRFETVVRVQEEIIAGTRSPAY